MDREWDWELIWTYLPDLLDGLVITIEATLGGMLLALVVGLLWCGGRLAQTRWIATPTWLLIEFLRSTPLLIQLVFLYGFLIPALGWKALNAPLVAGIIGIGLHYSGYTAEIFRASIQDVPKGQREASTALNLSPAQRFCRVILPQAISRATPALGNRLIAMTKDTPLLAAVTLMEMLTVARNIGSEHFSYLELVTVVGVLFLILSLILAQFVRLMEYLMPVRHA